MDEDQFFKPKAENNIFKQIIYKYLPFWPLFLVTTSVSLLITFIILRAEIPTYVAQATVLLKDPNKGGGDSKVLDALNIFSEKKIVENEIMVLRSSDILQEVVKDLNIYSTVYNKGNVRVEELYVDNTPVQFIAIDIDKLNSYARYFFKMDWVNHKVIIDNKSVSFDSVVLLDNNYFRIVANKNYNTGVVGKNYFVQFTPLAGAAGGLIGAIRANPLSSSSTIINVNMETPVPKKGMDVLNKLFEIYNLNAISDKNQIASRTLNFIEDRLGVVIGQLDSVEKNAARYKSRESITDLSSQATSYLSTVKELDKKVSDLDLQLDILNDIGNYIQNKGSKPGTVPSLLLMNDPTLSSLLGNLYNSEFDLEKARSISGEKSEPVILAAEKVNRIKNDISENMVNIRANLIAEKNQINAGINANSRQLRQIPEKERQFLDISRQQAIKNNIYTFLLQKREETAISSASTIADLRVIESPTSYGPIKPIPKNFYLEGLVIGLLSGAFIVLLKEMFSRKILFRAEIEEKTKVPVAGEILQASGKDPIVILPGKRTVVAEQFRSLRTNMSFMGLTEQKNTVLITSSVSGEGKSFIAINLAISITLTGKRVALVEMDLRKPKISKTLNVTRSPGISNYLVDKCSFEDMIKETQLKDLYVVSSGPLPPNPAELISMVKFKEMMDEIKKRFDYVIIDTAPIAPVTDAQLLQKYADINMFVIRHNVTPKIFLKMIDTLHQQQKFRNMCILFNGIKPRGFRISGYGLGGYGNGYSYGYGYGYGYGTEYGGGYYVDATKSPLAKIKKFFRK
ncbi:MAG: polysaccharide biosynthesis tyrosine autokinase [Ginsengibacter sp.]